MKKWAEYVSEKERGKLEQPTVIQKINKIIEDCKTDLNKLWILDIFANDISKDNVKETVRLIFDEDMDMLVENVEAELEVAEISDINEKIREDLRIGEAIRADIAKEDLERIKDKVETKVKDSTKKTKEGIHLLSLYMREDFDKLQSHIVKKGFERTWETFSGEKVDLDEIVKTGLIYKKHRKDSTRSFWDYVVPNYSLNILEDIAKGTSNLAIPCSTPTESEIEEKIEEKEVKKFIKWMSGTEKYIKASSEEEQLREELEDKEISLTLDELKEIRDKLVKENMLIFHYSPQRNNTQDKTGKPATWKYKLTKPVIDSVPILRWRPAEFA